MCRVSPPHTLTAKADLNPPPRWPQWGHGSRSGRRQTPLTNTWSLPRSLPISHVFCFLYVMGVHNLLKSYGYVQRLHISLAKPQRLMWAGFVCAHRWVHSDFLLIFHNVWTFNERPRLQRKKHKGMVGSERSWTLLHAETREKPG